MTRREPSSGAVRHVRGGGAVPHRAGALCVALAICGAACSSTRRARDAVRPTEPGASPHAAILQAVRDEWGWAIAAPRDVRAVSKFGNVLVVAQDGGMWRLCPEELAHERVLDAASGLAGLLADAQFRADWEMAGLVARAEAAHGVQPPDRCFCLKLPGVLGGTYTLDNVATISVVELVGCSGRVARQIADVPDGRKVILEFVR